MIAAITLRRLKLPLAVPYRLSYRTFHEFEPILIEARAEDGHVGWGEGHISPGSSAETRKGGWDFCRRLAPQLVGRTGEDAQAHVLAHAEQSPVAATALVTAFEMVAHHPILDTTKNAALPLVTPVNANEPTDIDVEIEDRLGAGYRTFKVKVGNEVEADAARLARIQGAVRDRARLRVDANRGFSREQALEFVRRVDWAGIELFEQPCPAGDWRSNAAVAHACPAPLMLDEAICSIADIERAATTPGVGYCKVKLKRFGGLGPLLAAIERAKALGLNLVLGDGLSSDVGCWMEARVAAETLQSAGEFNGFLKPEGRLLANPYGLEEGRLVLPQGYWPELDRARVDAHCLERLAV